MYSVIFALVLYWRFAVPLTRSLPYKKGRRFRRVAAVLFSLSPLYNAIVYCFYGKYFFPEMPTELFAIKTTFQMFLLIGAYLVLIRDGINIAYCFIERVRQKKALFRPFKFAPVPDFAKSRRGALLLTVLTCITVAIGFQEGLKDPVVRNETIVIENLPAAFNGLRVVQLSDIHVYGLITKDKIDRLVDRVNSLHPDVIAITGDIADGDPVLRAKDLSAFKNLRSSYGVFGVEGNHEHYGDIARSKTLYESLGIKWLINSNAILKKDAETLAVAGLTDVAASDFDREKPDLTKALTGIPPSVPVLLLAHDARYAREIAKNSQISLMLSGHTHAGQVLGINLLAALRSYGFLHGAYTINRPKGPSMLLDVNGGTFLFSGFPLRIFTKNEITCMMVRKSK